MPRFIWLLFGILFIVFCQEKQIATEQIKIPVQMAMVRQQQLAPPIRTSGRLSSGAEMKLSFKVGGYVDRIYHNEGDLVEAGALLASLKLDEIDAQVKQAQGGYDKAMRDFKRAASLYRDSVITRAQYLDAETGLTVAKSRLQIAQFNLKHAQITAPSKGRLLRQLMESNEMVGPGIPVFLFGSQQKAWKVHAGVSDREMLLLASGDSASVHFDVYKGRNFAAKVVEIAGVPDPGSGMYDVTLNLSETSILFDGFTADVRIFPSARSRFFVIPIEALVETHGDQAFVFTCDKDSLARKLSVTIGFVNDGQAAIVDGLNDVVSVITEGSAYLSEGSVVEVAE